MIHREFNSVVAFETLVILSCFERQGRERARPNHFFLSNPLLKVPSLVDAFGVNSSSVRNTINELKMSGSKRNSQYRKGATSDFLSDDIELDDGDLIAQVISSKGSNLFEIRVSGGDQGLAILPNKFRNLIWIKRNDFIVVTALTTSTTDEMNTDGDQSRHSSSILSTNKYEVKEILSKNHIKQLKARKIWPTDFIQQRIDDEDARKTRSEMYMDEDNMEEEEGYEDDEEDLPRDARGNTKTTDI